MTDAWRNRLVTASLVAGFVVFSHVAWPSSLARARHQYLLVIALGYGHLIGAAVFSRPRLAGWVPVGVSRRLFATFVAVSVLDLFALYLWLSSRSTACFLPLLALSMWHIAENDLALERAYRGRLALSGLPRALAPQLAALAVTALLVAIGQALLAPADYGPALANAALVRAGNEPARVVAAACGLGLAVTGMPPLAWVGFGVAGAAAVLPSDLTRWLSFGDFFSAVTSYHLLQFLVFFADRLLALPDAAARRRLALRLVRVHLAPLALCAALGVARDARLAALRYAIFSPAVYLFWSVLHVAQTIAARGIGRAARAGAVRA